MVEPDLGVRGRGRGAAPDGQLTPQPVPVRAARHRGRGPHYRGRQRSPVPQARRRSRCAGTGRRRAFSQRAAAATTTASELRPLLLERLATKSAQEWFGDPHRGWASRAGRSTTSAAASSWPRASGWSRWSWPAACRPSRNPIRMSATPAAARTAPAGAGRRRRRPSAPGSASAPAKDPRLSTDRARHRSFPTSLGTSEGTSITLLGQDLATDLMGHVSFGELAYWLITLRRPTPQAGPAVRGGPARRWPTTASRRPRSRRG